ncbi:MAG: GHKL domain-containing protein, partial [Cyclobacteriaceae bacterium]|nr:GHKL domain-containing protein [Cyclobacteriaceae bacterium]
EELRQSNDQLVATNEYLQKAQRQLVESEKMASLGQLTAGIAHEINNPINFISGGVQAINAVTEEFLEKKDRTPEMLEATIRDIQDLMGSINNGVTRTASIITGLKNFASPSDDINDSMDVTECIENSVILMNRKIADHDISIEITYQHHSRIPASGTQISQVLINLIDNAIGALKNMDGPRHISIGTQELANELLIKVKDNGTGIPEKDQPRIFEPFYTTKEVGSGVGLGLSISFSIIERHKGKITFVSKSGEGTEFTIALPLSI